jgi:hypothetical protein
MQFCGLLTHYYVSLWVINYSVTAVEDFLFIKVFKKKSFGTPKSLFRYMTFELRTL